MKFRELIMEWKYIDNLQMGPPSTNDCVGNMDEVKYSKEVIESNIEKNDERW